jgi:hypothetical protein
LSGHLRAALDHASDETARFHIRHAIQLAVEQAPNQTADGEQRVEADGDDRAGPGV